MSASASPDDLFTHHPRTREGTRVDGGAEYAVSPTATCRKLVDSGGGELALWRINGTEKMVVGLDTPLACFTSSSSSRLSLPSTGAYRLGDERVNAAISPLNINPLLIKFYRLEPPPLLSL